MCLVLELFWGNLVYQNEQISLVISFKCAIYFSLEILSWKV